jgi:hypothetical protein
MSVNATFQQLVDTGFTLVDAKQCFAAHQQILKEGIKEELIAIAMRFAQKRKFDAKIL